MIRMVTCERCLKDAAATTMSMFNTETICLDCKEKERVHPDYARASEAELEAVRRGDRNFPGIGKPDDL